MTIDVERLRYWASTGDSSTRWANVTRAELTELLDAYEERERLRDEIERAAQLAVEAKNTILKLRGSLDFAQTETERDRLRTALAYYAEPRNHHDDYLHTNDSYDDLKLPGSRARAALEGRE